MCYNIQQYVRIAITGSSGRMGQQLIKEALQHSGNVVIGAALAKKDSSLLGVDIGELVGSSRTGITIQNSIEVIQNNFDILVDFTSPKSTLNYLVDCCQYGKGMVIGTTGFNEIDKEKIRKASQHIPIVFSANFSIGVNIVLKLLEKVARVIDNNTDIDIIEMHHRHKIDIPSGTALAMGDVIAQVLNKDLKSYIMYDELRKCYIANNNSKLLHTNGSINFSTVRAGDIIGEHTVMFNDIHERIEITHKVSNRSAFAKGAIRAAFWLKDKDIGIFNMCDVLNLNNF